MRRAGRHFSPRIPLRRQMWRTRPARLPATCDLSIHRCRRWSGALGAARRRSLISPDVLTCFVPSRRAACEFRRLCLLWTRDGGAEMERPAAARSIHTAPPGPPASLPCGEVVRDSLRARRPLPVLRRSLPCQTCCAVQPSYAAAAAAAVCRLAGRPLVRRARAHTAALWPFISLCGGSWADPSPTGEERTAGWLAWSIRRRKYP